eukprot:CAMPEP_0114612102 /NCGR_PEP_ID=MMETSP0168-20121206/4452_1 /TAXON_ID=95228 ORGANISM="Vannella sp., Strain DIVA3 517/6/12" /NCGR_SAMPLE_ID=MMETSP0168 /ASSEMBLY_ACC=CAM_ASM_000044 /LENGTH=411 /DNA_ID=CAMNT_0001823083 /DNA_START=151 /DNA_END=1386 /DNA_ORIENTATION=+
MKLTLKTLSQEELHIEVDAEASVLVAKQEIEKKFSHPVEQQKLIFAGKILQDDNTIASYNIPETGFLVLLVRKAAAAAAPAAKPAAAPAATPAAAPAASPAAAPAATATAPAATAPAASAPAASAPAASAPAATAPSTPAASAPASTAGTPEAGGIAISEEIVDRICEMGFDKEQVRAALRASFGNPDRAVEYLMNGGPPAAAVEDMMVDSPVRSPGTMNVHQAAQQAGGVPAAGSPAPSPGTGNLFQMAQQAAVQQAQQGNPDSPLDDLRRHPLFNSLRQQVQQNPQILSQVMAQLGASNPALLQRITENQEEFLNMLNEPVPPGTPTLAQLANAQGGMPGPGAGGGQELPPNYIQVTPEEREAIERLQQLGFERHRVIEAFFACDKDETLAANYLLNNMGNDDDDMMEG